MSLVEEEGKQNPSLGLEDISYGEGVIRFDHRRGILHNQIAQTSFGTKGCFVLLRNLQVGEGRMNTKKGNHARPRVRRIVLLTV